MVQPFRVEFSELEADVTTWSDWSSDLREIAVAIPMVGESGLHPLSFSRVMRGQEVRQAYESVSQKLSQYLADGADQAQRTGSKLTAVVRIYRDAEDDNLDDISRH